MDDSLARNLSVPGRIDEDVLEQLAHNEKMAELGHLAAGVIHEVNTPLSVIVSAAQMILREGDIPDFVREMVERIDMEAQRLSQYTRGVLSFARTGAEAEAEADVNQVLQEVMAFLRYEARKRSITVIEELDYDVLLVAADNNRLKQIFINLIMNACQAMDQGGALHVRTTMPDDRSVRIEIADTGKGIPPERLDRIFEPFYTTKKPGEGTGLGLYIVRKMVELMGGRIEVKSSVGEGTTFTIMLPQP
ncbi:MAG TPA: HAMP domain-containing sensor histidine kinase [Geobacteraceae bacterium]|nr:HAMP domain-containing sensor histidine kinase [Geobacteraceae bacterium]